MSGYNPYGNPQYPPPQNPIYPQLYNPAQAPVQGQPGQPAPGYPNATPQFPPQYQQGYTFPYPGQPQAHPQPGHPASLSYPNVTPSAPPPTGGFNVGYPGYPAVTPTPVQTIEWIPSTVQTAMQLSDKALVGGYEGWDGSPLWVIRARHEGDLIPGKLAIKHHAAYVPWGGQENSVASFEVCCARPEAVRWVECKSGVVVPPNAVPGGNTANGEPLYIGRVKHEKSLTPGKVHPSHKCLYISFGGKEIPHKVYEVLCTV